jgi:hypothetical protein
MSRQITFVEMELGTVIYGEYPLMKFLQQYEDICYFKEQERRAMKKK